VSDLPDFMRALGLSIESTDEDGAIMRMDVPADLMSPFGAVHGGVVATLLDTALAVAIHRRLEPGDRIATHNLNVTYVAFSRERVLRCRTRVVSLRTAVAHAEGEVVTEGGLLIAKGLGTFGVRRGPT
jgi:uncharacterized protein (TIGR00369 family)